MSNADVVRACQASYVAQDRASAERLIADDFEFSSPYDDRLDRAGFFERCFPTVRRFRSQEVIHVAPAGDDDVFLLYECELTTGERFRNVELSTVRDGRITRTQVFFGACL